ncbi:MAG: hypothetical protein K2G83_07045, partial [Ruminococcus sp.]|nr:hypothetical protein [Ruminococcus sp.]
MALFKKKNQAEETGTAETREFDYKVEVLKALNEKLKGNLYDECIIMPRGYTIDVKIGKHEEKEEVKLVQVIFIVNHDDFDEPLIDPVDAQGKNYEEAAKMAADIFYGGVWHPIEQAKEKKNPIHIPVTYLNQHYDFDMYAQSIVRIGTSTNAKPVMLLAFIKNEIPKYLGSKKYYWLRIYLAKHKDREIIEVRVNGSVCSELHKFFKPYIDSWDASSTFICEKQYGFFVQRDDDKCPFKKETVVNAARAALEKMVKVSNRDEYMAMADELEEIAGDKDIAAEVRLFIPEILAKLTLGYQEGDSAESVTKALGLPVQLDHEVSVTWQSSAPTVITEDGHVFRPVGDGLAVALTASISRGDAEPITKTFTVYVPEKTEEAPAVSETPEVPEDTE